MNTTHTDEYRATATWPYAISAGCVVYRRVDGVLHILLLKRAAGDFPQLLDGDKDTFHLPKGGVARNETLEQAALRETAEEAGVTVAIRGYLGSKINQWNSHHGFRQHKTVHYFAGEWQRDLAAMDAEHSEKLWMPYQAAYDLLSKQANPKEEQRFVQHLHQFLELQGA